VSLGLGGKHEFTAAVRSLAEEAEGGELAPEDIDEDDVEERLVFPEEPDLVIKTGAERLSDFMIWQSVYSELYFTDVNWGEFRERDYLRAIREYKRRSRRFGQ
jgi:undecaprenyl diphosphate synthase